MENRPFLLKPAAKDYLWGGRRLNDDFGKRIDVYPLAETWECSTHPDGQSSVASGEMAGRLLGDVLAEHPDWLGSHPLSMTGGRPELPILVKLIDAREDLSVQVHPDDAYALEHENSLGKTEMWYVLAAEKGARLIYGFNQDVSPQQVRRAAGDGTIMRYLNRVPVNKDDVFFIEAGTVHALGAGCLVAEIQEASNITYRFYDHDRTDRDGKKRPLHVEKALEVADLSSSASPRQPMRTLRYRSGCAQELLTRCRYFQVERLLLNTVSGRPAELSAGANSFRVLLCVDGGGVISSAGGEIPFFKGDCVFVPADSVPLALSGRAQLLNRIFYQ